MAKTVLVVDDSCSVRLLLGLSLKGAGYQVVEAVDGEDAIDKLDGRALDLIVSDLSMPRMDGLGFLRYLRLHPRYKATPLMLVTTETRVQVKEAARRQGAQAFVNKPVTPSDFLSAVKRLCA